MNNVCLKENAGKIQDASLCVCCEECDHKSGNQVQADVSACANW